MGLQYFIRGYRIYGYTKHKWSAQFLYNEIDPTKSLVICSNEVYRVVKNLEDREQEYIQRSTETT